MTSLGTFRLLKDHYINGEYVYAGEVREMFSPWTPSGDAEPLDATALAVFYAAGPQVSGCIRTHFSHAPITAPVTYWRRTTPPYWQLTGLGSSLMHVATGSIGMIKDKEP